MGVATGCGCKEVYRFPHTTNSYSSFFFFFLQHHPNFLFFLNVFRSLIIYDVGKVYCVWMTDVEISVLFESKERLPEN